MADDKWRIVEGTLPSEYLYLDGTFGAWYTLDAKARERVLDEIGDIFEMSRKV